jgi:hypothetical protein
MDSIVFGGFPRPLCTYVADGRSTKCKRRLSTNRQVWRMTLIGCVYGRTEENNIVPQPHAH